MPSTFEKTEDHVAQSLKAQPDSTKAFSNELHDLQRCETPDRFKQDMGKLNDDLHKHGLLPGLQIVENGATHDFELKKIGDSPEPTDRREQPHGGGSGSEYHGHHHKHHGRHHHHHKHHGGRDNDGDHGDENDAPDNHVDKGDKGIEGALGADKNDRSQIANDGSQMSTEDKEKYIVNRLTDNHEGGLHLSKMAAAGAIGSLEGESPNLYSGRVDHKHEHDLGFANWIGDRKHDLEKFAKSQGKDATDFKTQVDFMEKELKANPHGVLTALQNAKSVEQAARDFTSKYEVPGIPHMQARVNNALVAFENIGKWQQMGANDGDAYQQTA